MKLVIFCVVLVLGYVYAEDCKGMDLSTCTQITCRAGYTVRCLNNVCSCAKLFFKTCTTTADCTGLCADDPAISHEHCFDGICICYHQ